MRRGNGPWIVIALGLLALAAWWCARPEPAAVQPREPVSEAAPAPPPGAPAPRPSTTDEARSPEALQAAQPDGGCEPRVWLSRPEGADVAEVTVVDAGVGAGHEPILLLLEFPDGDGGPRTVALEAPGPRFFLATCGAQRLVVRGTGLDEHVGLPGIFDTITLAATIDAPPLESVVGRVTRLGRPMRGVEIQSISCVPAVTGEDGRFTAACRGPRVLLWAKEPWQFTSSPYGLVEDGGTLDLGDLVVRPRPVELGKVGIEWDPGRLLTVRRPLPFSPAERAGLRAGDVVLEVDGRGIASFEDALRLIPGPADTVVRLKIRRGADILLVDVRRQGMAQPD